MAGIGQKRVRDKDGKRRALLEAATEVFAEDGYDGAVTKEISERAGCSESLIFRYFGDKQGLFEAVASRQVADAVREGEEKVACDLPESFHEYIERLCRARLPSRNGDSVDDWNISARALVDQAFSLRVILPNHRARTKVIAEGIRHYQGLGQVAADLDPNLLAEVLGNAIIYTTTMAPRLFGTRSRSTRAQMDLLARIFAVGAGGAEDRD